VFSPGEFVCQDESMSRWDTHREQKMFGNVLVDEVCPHITREPRKPTPVAVMFLNMACSESMVVFALELAEGKEAMVTKPYRQETGSAGTSIVLRLAEVAGLFNAFCVICGDSLFASVKSAHNLFQHGLYFMVIVKTASALYPKQYANALSLERGDSAVLTANYKDANENETPLISHVWQDRTRKCFVSTCDKTTAGTSHKRVRMRFNSHTGKIEKYVKETARTRLVEQYFQAAPTIDVFNHLRMSLGIEDAWRTKIWWVRCFAAVMSFVFVNAYRMYHYDQKGSDVRTILNLKKFKIRVIEGLLHNDISAAFEHRFSRRINKLHAREGVDDEETGSDSDQDACVLGHNSQQAKSHHPKQLTCVMCTASKRHNARGRPYTSTTRCLKCDVSVCGPATGRSCMFEHIKANE
jgi:hypothetical protein